MLISARWSCGGKGRWGYQRYQLLPVVDFAHVSVYFIDIKGLSVDRNQCHRRYRQKYQVGAEIPLMGADALPELGWKALSSHASGAGSVREGLRRARYRKGVAHPQFIAFSKHSK